MKLCEVCGVEKEINKNNFYLRKHVCKDGTITNYAPNYCKDCEKKTARENKKRKYHDPSTRPRVLELAKARTGTEEYKSKAAEKVRIKYQTDPEFRQKFLDSCKATRTDPVRKEKLRIRKARYYQNHKQEIMAKSKEKINASPHLKLRGYMRCRISEALSRHGRVKGKTPSLKYLDYTWEDFYAHIESKLEDWMHFDNYGMTSPPKEKWQIDHIIPQKFFPYDSMSSDLFKMCWDLRNLRPLCSHQNATDGNRPHIFNQYEDVSQIFADLRNFRPQHEGNLDSVLSRLRSVAPVDEVCTLSTIGLSYLDSVFPARFDARTRPFPSYNEAIKDDWLVYASLLYMAAREDSVTPISLSRNIRHAIRMPGHFYPAAAASIVKRYCPDGDVFDPFLGWGGRALGSLSLSGPSYTGCDLQSSVVTSCEEMSTELKKHNSSSPQSEFHCTDSLEYLKTTDRKFDLIFSSPPFLDTEDYGVNSASMGQDWIDDFAFPFLEKCKLRMRDSGHLAFHLKDVKGSPTYSVYHSAAKAAGFKKRSVHSYGPRKSQSIHVYSL